MRKVVIAPDSFKGTLSSVEVCDIISQVISEKYPDTEVKRLPVADGGEGTAEALLQCLGGRKIHCRVTSPLGRELDGFYLKIDDETAIIESAVASGLTLEKKNDALLASSYGTGQLIKKAVSDGAKSLIIGIGGSAMTDGGIGCLAALGVKFYDEDKREVHPCGKSLEWISSIDISGLDEAVKQCSITVLCDVKNCLYGENGAAFVFAKQKGADEKDILLLDNGLRHFATVCERILCEDFSLYEGAGAAGGLGFALKAFLGAQMKSGIDTVLDLCNFEAEAEGADLIITGEGCFDSQSLMGKVIPGITRRSKGKRVVAVAGISTATEAEVAKAGISQLIECNERHLPFEEIKHLAKAMLYQAAEKIIL